jgi:4-hydroxyphenylacetate 3-monooxygenase
VSATIGETRLRAPEENQQCSRSPPPVFVIGKTPDASASNCRVGDFVLLLVMAWSRPAHQRRDRLGFNTRRLRHLEFQPHPGRHLVQFAQSPHFNHLNAVYNAFDFPGPLKFVKKAAGLPDRVDGTPG